MSVNNNMKKLSIILQILVLLAIGYSIFEVQEVKKSVAQVASDNECEVQESDNYVYELCVVKDVPNTEGGVEFTLVGVRVTHKATGWYGEYISEFDEEDVGFDSYLQGNNKMLKNFITSVYDLAKEKADTLASTSPATVKNVDDINPSIKEIEG